jgi:hypothetical protein
MPDAREIRHSFIAFPPNLLDSCFFSLFYRIKWIGSFEDLVSNGSMDVGTNGLSTAMFVCLDSVIRKLQKGLDCFPCLSVYDIINMTPSLFFLHASFSFSLSTPQDPEHVHVCVCESWK